MHHFTNGQLVLYTATMVVLGALVAFFVVSFYMSKVIKALEETIERKDELIESLDCANTEVKRDLVQSHAARESAAVDDTITRKV